jgi:hypothetical protein
MTGGMPREKRFAHMYIIGLMCYNPFWKRFMLSSRFRLCGIGTGIPRPAGDGQAGNGTARKTGFTTGGDETEKYNIWRLKQQ